jgi:hypothetical protein
MSALKFLFFFFLISLIIFSCKKDSFITSHDAKLNTSADTLFYDTVFTSTGSVTQSFKIFNDNNQKLKLSSVKLSGGALSAFKINVDGTASNEVDDIEINANDSIYVFVQVSINPTAANLPFIVRDSILINYNGNQKYVQLQAYGQNAIFLKDIQLTGNNTWNNTLPYVILGGIDIDTDATLTVEKGTRIYLHANAPFLVDGTLIVNGTKQDSVIFNGDRLDPDYRDLPASWPGIFFRENSKNNVLTHAVIKNAYQGIIAQELSTTSNPKVIISQCIIDNIYDAGVLGIHTNINADNCLISNCGSNIQLALGGDYNFIHCTVASYGNLFITHKNPVLQLSDFAIQNGNTLTNDLNASFTNCIFWGDNGNVDNEIATEKKGNGLFNITFNNVLYKAKTDPAFGTFNSPIKNSNPLFDSINVSKSYFDFHLQSSSPAVDAGNLSTINSFDLDDKKRITPPPDLGCYER